MSNIQLYQFDEIIQMSWHGQIIYKDIETAFQQLVYLLDRLLHQVNLVIVVDTDTNPAFAGQIVSLPPVLHHARLRGWMIIGKDAQANHFIADLITHQPPRLS